MEAEQAYWAAVNEVEAIWDRIRRIRSLLHHADMRNRGARVSYKVKPTPYDARPRAGGRQLSWKAYQADEYVPPPEERRPGDFDVWD